MLERRVMPPAALFSTYKRLPIAFARGEGVYLWDTSGKRYLDFLAGIAVCALGHAHPRLVKRLTDQGKTLWHVSNLFEIPEQAALAEALVSRMGMASAFFCNSGAEANEALIKLSRLWGKRERGGAYEVITLKRSFHGRTMQTLTATGQDKVKTGFDPLPPGFVTVAAEDEAALEAAISERTAAILLEVVQAEGGVYSLSAGYLRAVRRLCDRHRLLFMVDEVQTGMGRTGAWCGFQSVPDYADLRVDAISLGKGLAGGFPMGACLASEKAADLFTPGSHGSTFGGSPLASALALEVVCAIEAEDLLARARRVGAFLANGLRELQKKHAMIQEVRGRGLLLACVLDPKIDALQVVMKGFERGVIFNAVQGHVLRFVPALVMEESHAAEGLEILDRILEGVRA